MAYNRGLMPLFEAVQNSIHAIEDADLPVDTGRITVEIVRDPKKPLEVDDSPNRPGPASVPDICGFRIRDNGIGFTEHHMTSFETLDTDHRADIGGRGVGRLLWLKAFDRATLDSTYFDRTNRKARRRFTSHSRTASTRSPHSRPKQIRTPGQRSSSRDFAHDIAKPRAKLPKQSQAAYSSTVSGTSCAKVEHRPSLSLMETRR